MGLLFPVYASAGGNWSPAKLSLAAWLRNYGGGTWSGTASLGVSGDGSHDFADPGNEPATGATLNGYGTADFNGTNDYLLADGDWGDYYTSSISGWALINPDDVATSGQYVFCVAYGGRLSLAIGASSGRLSLNYNSGVNSVYKDGLSNGTWALATFRHTGSNIQVGINEAPGASGGASTAAYASSLASTENVALGSVEDGSFNYYNGRIAEFGLYNGNLDDSVYAQIKAYANSFYGLSL